jgi:CheY-like chemotaxis protein
MNQNTMPQGSDILVVDDDPAIRALVTELLADEGYRFRSACDGLQAWQAIASAPPALLLTDLRMPVMNGTILVTRVRASGYDFPILLMAATPALAEPLLQLDRIAFIAKPFELDVLLNTIRRSIAPAAVEVV